MATGEDYLDNKTGSYCAYVTKDNKQHNASSVKQRGKHLFLQFGGSEVTADILIRKSKDRIILKVVSVSGTAE